MGSSECAAEVLAAPRKSRIQCLDALWWLPLAVLLAAYFSICVRYRSAWPWQLTVHEDGHHTLLGTVLFFEHALGELPLEWLLGLSVAGAVLGLGGESGVRRVAPAAVAAIGLDALIAVGAWWRVGPRDWSGWLLQYHTRPGEPLLFGSHWGYHLLSEASLMLLAFALVAWAGASRDRTRRAVVFWISCGAFAVLSAVFGLSAAPFRDARYLGHEARETVTHALVTVPLAVALCVRIARCGVHVRRAPPRARWAFGGFLLLAAYQVAGAVLAGSRSRAQSGDLVSLIGVHFFEHVLSYLVVAAHACLFYTVLCRTGAKGAR